MYFVIVIDRDHGGRASYFDQAEPALLKNRRIEATEWADYSQAQQACCALQNSLPPFQLASVRQDWRGSRPAHADEAMGPLPIEGCSDRAWPAGGMKALRLA